MEGDSTSTEPSSNNNSTGKMRTLEKKNKKGTLQKEKKEGKKNYVLLMIYFMI